MVVPVLMKSCQVSLKSKMGPVTAQRRMIATAMAKVAGLPVACEADFAKCMNHEVRLRVIDSVPFCEHEMHQCCPSSIVNCVSFQFLYFFRSRSTSINKAPITVASSSA